MKVRIVNSDSFGVRSMATVVEGEEIRIFIDPGAALGPRRYGLPPAEEEMEALEEAKLEIIGEARECEVIIITHYHFDHYFPYEGFYRGKRLIVKDGREMINWSQKRRSYTFFKHLHELGVEPEQTNGGVYKLGDLLLEISPPFPHGPEGTRLGHVLMLYFKDEENSFLFTSDVQGPISNKALRWILERRPDTVFLDGPATYLGGVKLEEEDINVGIENLRTLSSAVGTLIVDHHMLRDLSFREYLEGLSNVKTAAEFMGKDEKMLEAHRRELWASKRKT